MDRCAWLFSWRDNLLLLRRIKVVGRCYAAARRPLHALGLQALLQGTQELQHDGGPAVVTHEADSPGLALEVAEPTADLDGELVEQSFAHGKVIDTGRNSDGVQLG